MIQVRHPAGPFPVEEEITWSIRHHRHRHPFFQAAFPNQDGDNGACHQQFRTIITVDCVAIKKPKTRARANVSLVESSSDEEDLPDQDGDDDMAGGGGGDE